MSGGKVLDKIEIVLRNYSNNDKLTIYVDTYESALGRKWLSALNDLIRNNYLLEKNFCFLGFVESQRDGQYLLDQINATIAAVNRADLGYYIDDHFSLENTLTDDPIGTRQIGRNLVHDKFNWLHRYFEDLQGVSGKISPYYLKAAAATRWHIRQLNLLCHEFESWALSYRKEIEAPMWRRPSQLMCWLNAPRFKLEEVDYELFGIETINRPLGGVFVGVNKAVGKHHWEVFNDEGRDSRIDELVSTTMRGQSEAAGDFDIEWANNPQGHDWQQNLLNDFRTWLKINGFDPEDKSLTIGYPQVGQIDLQRSFGTTNYEDIWAKLGSYLDVYSIKTSDALATYDYHWSDSDFVQRQVAVISQGY